VSYLGSAFHEFWSRCGSNQVHPDDRPYLDAYAEKTLADNRQTRFQTNEYLPCPFDGPLQDARVVVCLSNPNYPKNGSDFREVIIRQRSGEESLPIEWDSKYYKKIAKSLNLPLEVIRRKVAVFNVCPYASSSLEGVEKRVAAGLPSVWAAQKFFREVLLPKAGTGNIYLIVLRKHELWGVTESAELGNLRLIRGREQDGSIPADVGLEIKNWLIQKGHLSSNELQPH
jgi:hypothetical protein